MDAVPPNNQKDDHNTNQNEAAMAHRPLLGIDKPQSHSKVDDTLENGEQAVITTDSKCTETPVQTKGTSTPAIISDIRSQITETNTCDLPAADKEHTNTVIKTTESNQMNEGGSSNTNTKAPPDRGTECVPNTPNINHGECSNTDISVTSDEDIKVTCRFSSTPVNSSLNKSLNESDCSMSSVGAASPIPSLDHSKMSPGGGGQHCHSHEPNTTVQRSNKDGDKIDDDNMVYLQPQIYSNKHTGDNSNTLYKQPQSKGCNLYYMDRNQATPFTPFQQNYSSDPAIRSYSDPSLDYQPNFVENQQCGFSDYDICTRQSLTDIKTRPDAHQMNVSPGPELCCYPMAPGGMSDRDYFVYPSIYVSNAGLISVLLRNDMSVEMTVDRTIRVVSHNHMMAVATDSKGTAASLYHPAAKIFQMGYNTDIATDTFRAKITQGEAIFFSNGINCFKLQDTELKPTTPIKFSDILRDQSVNLLFSSEGYGESLVATCMQVAAQAEYANLPKGGVIVRINDVKVTQSGCGDVTVVTGAKFIRLSPHNGTTRLGNRFVDIEVERDWSVKLTRGTHTFVTNKKRTMVSNGKMEAGFDESNSLKVINLQGRHPLISEPNLIRRPGKRITRTPPGNASTFFTPRRRGMTPLGGRGGGAINTC